MTAIASELLSPAEQSSRPETLREAGLLSAVDKFLDVDAAWVESKAILLTADYEDAILEMFQEFATGSLPANCRQLAAAVSDLQSEWRAYEATVTRADPMPGDRFWGARDKVRIERSGANPVIRRPLEPLRILIDQKVSARQIALMYGYNDPKQGWVGPFIRNGHPQEHLVYQELEQPGSVIPQDWVHPADAAREAEARKLDQLRLARLEERRVIRKPCPESIEELLRQRVSPRQIADMHGVDVQTVLAEAEQLGLPAESSAAEILATVRQHNPLLPEDDALAMMGTGGPLIAGANVPDIDAHDLDGYPEDDSRNDLMDDDIDDEVGDQEGNNRSDKASDDAINARIVELASKGRTSVDIAREVGVTIQKAAAVIRAAKRKESAGD